MLRIQHLEKSYTNQISAPQIADHLQALAKLAPVEEFTPFGAAASSNGALPTPYRLSEHILLLLCDVAQKTRTWQTTHTV